MTQKHPRTAGLPDRGAEWDSFLWFFFDAEQSAQQAAQVPWTLNDNDLHIHPAFPLVTTV